jgi:hypothetical protein
MTDSMNLWNDFINDQVACAAVDLIGPPPFAIAAAPRTAFTNAVDPEAVATEVFGTRIDLSKRDQLIALLERVLPASRGSTSPAASTVVRPGSCGTHLGGAMVGPFAPVYLAAQTLLTNGQLLLAIKPIRDTNAGGCDYQQLIPLIQETVSALVHELSTPDVPFIARVDVLLSTLCGYVDNPVFDVTNVGGCLGRLRDRCGLLPGNVSSYEDEQVMTAFSSYVALTAMIVSTWDLAKPDTGGAYLGVGIYALRRHLLAIVANLTQLRQAVPSQAVWATTELRTAPPMLAGKLYEWIYRYASIEALQTLKSGGRDGIAAIDVTMKKFQTLLCAGFLQSGEDSDGEGDCANIAPPFAGETVRDTVTEILCHIQRVLELTKDLGCNDNGKSTGTTPIAAAVAGTAETTTETTT